MPRTIRLAPFRARSAMAAWCGGSSMGIEGGDTGAETRKAQHLAVDPGWPPGHDPTEPMAAQTRSIPHGPVKQFSVFAENRVGRLYGLATLLKDNNVHIMALTVL